MKSQKLTVEGSVEPDKLIAYIRKKVHKHAEIIIPPKPEKKEEKKEVVKVEQVSTKATQTVEFMEEKITKLDDVPYCVQYAYDPPLYFSDENPNACYIL